MSPVRFGLVCVCLCFHTVTVLCQFGFYPQRESRRQYGFDQNFFPNPRRITENLAAILHFRPGNQDRNQQYIYPFNNIPGITNNRPVYDQYPPNYPNRTPNNVRFPESGRDIPNDNVNFEPTFKPYEERPPVPNPEFNNGGLISGNNGNNGLVSGNNNGRPIFSSNDNGGLISGNNNGQPIFDNNKNNGPTSGNDENGELIAGNNKEDRPVFGEIEDGGAINSYDDGKQEPPSPVMVVEQAEDENVPIFVDRNSDNEEPPADVPTSTLSPLTPVPDTESKNNFNYGGQGVFSETCETVDGNEGSCISIMSCQPYVKLLQQSQSNPEAVRVLRSAHCGFEGNNPKVCCPRQEIPDVPPPPPTPQPQPQPQPIPTASPKSVGDFLNNLPEPPECGISSASFSRVVGGINATLDDKRAISPPDGKWLSPIVDINNRDVTIELVDKKEAEGPMNPVALTKLQSKQIVTCYSDFPWMALLGYTNKRDGSNRWLCGGSLISSRHVLTAAHCIHNHEKDLHLVRLGELDLSRDDEGATPIDVIIKTKIKHEGYDARAYTNDIGILVLERDVQFTELIRPICIPKDAELRARSFVDYNPIIAGWGDTEFRGPSATLLQVLQLPVVSNEFCAQAYSQYKAQVIDKRVVCAGYKKGGRDACQGDSGGPLMQPIWNSETYKTFFYQIGVVSFGKRCAEPGYPGVYTRVTEFVPWIQKNLLGSA